MVQEKEERLELLTSIHPQKNDEVRGGSMFLALPPLSCCGILGKSGESGSIGDPLYPYCVETTEFGCFRGTEMHTLLFHPVFFLRM